MKFNILIITTLFILGCRSNEPIKLHNTVNYGKYELSDYEGFWSFTDQWQGCMGAALEIKGSEFKYWFDSDFKSLETSTYPIKGKVVVRDGILNLISKNNQIKKQWYLVKYENQIFGIIPLDDIVVLHYRNELPAVRMMALVSKSEKPRSWPIMNTQIPELKK